MDTTLITVPFINGTWECDHVQYEVHQYGTCFKNCFKMVHLRGYSI